MGWTVKNIFHALLLTLFFISIEAESKVKFIPSHYNIAIETNEKHFQDATELKYDGTVTVNFKKESSATEEFSIVLNTNKKTQTKNVKLMAAKEPKGTSGNSEDITASCPAKTENGKLTLNCKKEVAAYTDFTLTVSYSNPFGDDMTGFYRSSYKDSENKTRWLLTTHFEPIFARDAFPCFDQPDLKATFEVSLTVPENIQTVLSNTEVVSTIAKFGNLKTYTFKKTDIPMSTYLVAFTASDFISTSPLKFKSNYGSKDKDKDKNLRTYGREDIIKKGEGDFAQSVGKKAIELTTDYLNMGYALQKVDQVGIPDFSAGAMENFGHISFREKSLFYNKVTSSTMTKQSNLLTIVHELIHQWFGNLVTLESWDYIWLNEAFATYLEYVIANKMEGDGVDSAKWNLMQQMVVNEIHLRAFETDGLNTSKPLNNKITDEGVIFSSFNDIPYSKGAAVLRMWDLSHESGKFQESLKEYMVQRKEKSANPSQLFEAFKAKAGMQQKTFDTWTTQPGYPVVEVKKIKNETYTLSQSRFLWEKLSSSSSWHVPITYSTSEKKEFSNTVPKVWLESKNLELKDVKGEWIIVNNQQAGYYRVNYEKENWEALSKALKKKDFSDIPELNRAQIIDDIFSLARSLQKNYVNYSTALDLAEYLKNETSFIPLKTALNSFDFLRTKLYNDGVSKKFEPYVLEILKPHFKPLSSKEEKHIDELKKVEVTRWACSLNYEPCLKEAKTLYNSKNYTQVVDIQEIVLCTVVRTNKATWKEIFDKYKAEQDGPLRVMYLTALGCTDDSETAKKFLENTLDDKSGIRKQDLMFVLSAVYNGNLKNLDTALTFVEKNYTEIAKRYGGINPLGRAIVGIARKINGNKQCERLEALVKKVKESEVVKGTEESLDNAMQIAKSNCKWNSEKISQFRTYFNGSNSLASASLSLLLLCLFFLFKL